MKENKIVHEKFTFFPETGELVSRDTNDYVFLTKNETLLFLMILRRKEKGEDTLTKSMIVEINSQRSKEDKCDMSQDSCRTTISNIRRKTKKINLGGLIEREKKITESMGFSCKESLILNILSEAENLNKVLSLQNILNILSETHGINYYNKNAIKYMIDVIRKKMKLLDNEKKFNIKVVRGFVLEKIV